MLSARKHYTVDVWLGIVVASLVFIVFDEGWLPQYVHLMPTSLRLSSRLPLAGVH